MNTIFLTQLKSTLPEQTWPWVIAALRQDELVWETLQTNGSFLHAPTEADQRPESWNPARVAFLTLQQPVPAPKAALSLGLRQRAFRTYEAVTQPRQTGTTEVQPMVHATLLALALRERLRLTGKWDDLIGELSSVSYDIWCTPLACLYGLIEKPLDLLSALVIAGAPLEIYRLAIHTLFSNPLPPEAQSTQLQMLMENLPVPDQRNFLRQLIFVRPALAAELAKRITHATQSGTSGLPLNDLAEHSQRAEIALIAGNRTEALSAISVAQANARLVQASLAAQSAQVSDNPITSWQKAFEYAPEQPIYRSRLALAFIEANNRIEANAILDPSENAIHPDLLYTSARLAYLSGDIDRAKQLASQALSVINTQINPSSNHRETILSTIPSTIPSLFVPLARFLLTLNLPSAAIRAARFSIQESPSDPERLILMGQAQSAAGLHLQAAEAYQWAVLLDPRRYDLHRQLAESLEAAGEWALALEERKTMAAASDSRPDDQYALADCALHNKKPEYAVEICHSILVKSPTDGMAHTLLGEALAARGDLTSAQEHFTQASEFTQNLPRPWLASASAYNQSNQPQKALETLRTASQAIPGSADVHLALGEQYLSTNSPTQALSAFQRAAEIEPWNIPIALSYGKTLYQLGHLPQANQILKQAYQQDSTNIEVAHTYARILMSQDDPRTALPPLETVITSNPIDPAPFVDYARVILLTRGEAAKATRALQHALQLVPDHVEAQALLGEALAADNDFPASLKAYQIALETPLAQTVEWRSRLSYGLGNVALRLNKFEIAIAALSEAAQLEPQNYHPHCLLADAYQTAGLIPDAYQSAFEALRLAGDDLPVMIWYVEKTLELAGNGQVTENGTAIPNPRHEELRLHALQTLARAAEIAPAQANMLLRIANIQSTAGDPASAAANLRRIADVKSAAPNELQWAAQALSSINDASGAVLCLEKALDNIQETEDNRESRISILAQLAHAYQQANNPKSALQTIEKAIILSPDAPRLIRAKAHLLIELGQAQEALNFLEETLSRLNDPELHYITGMILRSQGKLLEALDHAEVGSQGPLTKAEIGLGQQFSAVLGAELTRALLLPDQARQALQNPVLQINEQNYSLFPLYYILCAEIALEDGQEIEAANSVGKALKYPDCHSPRLLALQARLAARHGDFQSARDIYQTALQSLGENDPGNINPSKQTDKKTPPSTALRFTPLTLQSTLYGLTETALELNLWGIALRLAQKAVQIAPAEPLANLNLARVLVYRAEYQYLCNDSEMVHHAPGPVALSEGTYHAFDQAIQDALTICDGLSQRSHIPAFPSSLMRWQIRGNAVLTPSLQAAQTLENWARESSNPEDVAASLAALRRAGSIVHQMEVNIGNVRHTGAILTQIALSITKDNPLEAQKALQIAILKEPIRNTCYALRHFLLARLAYNLNQPTASPAIQTAIILLPDEPRWCALAAKISLATGNKDAAIDHLKQAAQLEPRQIDHHLALGNLHLNFAREGSTSEALLAVKCFERATRLAPDQPEVWLTLAQAHRFAGNLEQASVAADRAAILAPEIIDSHLIQAEIALQSGKPQAAHDHAQTALNLQPDSHQAAIALSQALQDLDRPAEALSVIDKAIPASEQTVPLKLERVRLLRISLGPEKALNAANELAQLNPDEPAVLAILAEIQTEAGQEEIAIRTAQKAILLGENLPIEQQVNLRMLLGQLLRRAGQLDQAIHHLDEVIRLAPEKIEAYLELGRSHQDRRQQAQALLMYHRAANIAPHDPRPYLQAGLALKEGKDYLESESMLRRAANLDPNDPAIRRQLAAVIAINLVHNPRRSLQSEPV